MLLKLQKNTLVKFQVIGYFITFFFGVCIILLFFQLYIDTLPLMQQNSEVFKNNSAVISKEISVFKTLDKEAIYFSDSEIQELQEQPFLKNLSKFNNATFKIKAYSNKNESIPIFYTDLFFESIPNQYIEITTTDWTWNESSDFIPIIIPENYLNLYNFGFAESQGLPVLSKNTISEISFNLEISGKGRSKIYKSRIVGFSNKINSILVPEVFLTWANKEYGRENQDKTSRILIEFNNPSNENILSFFNEKNYSIGKEKLEFSKLIFFFKSTILFIGIIAVVVVLLSMVFIVMSFNLIIQKNKKMMQNLYNIGYSYKKIATFYHIVISGTTCLSVFLAVFISNMIRDFYINELNTFFDFENGKNTIFIFGTLILVCVLLIYNIVLIKNIKRAVIPVRN